LKFKDNVILITGACGLIASKVIDALDENEATLFLVDSNEFYLKQISANLTSKKSSHFVTDLKEVKNHLKILDIIEKKYGKLDCVIHLAYPRSAGWGTPFGKLSHKYLLEDLNNQLALPILLSQNILNYFEKQGYGNLIHVSSIQGISAPKFEHYEGTSMVSPIEYSAVKTALIGVTKYLAKFYKDKNIRVNCISPGGVHGGQSKEFLEKYRASCCAKGMLDPEDLVGAFLFLISDHSKFINGQNIVVDDGWSL